MDDRAAGAVLLLLLELWLLPEEAPGNGELRKVLSLFFHFLTPPPEDEDVNGVD